MLFLPASKLWVWLAIETFWLAIALNRASELVHFTYQIVSLKFQFSTSVEPYILQNIVSTCLFFKQRRLVKLWINTGVYEHSLFAIVVWTKSQEMILLLIGFLVFLSVPHLVYWVRCGIWLINSWALPSSLLWYYTYGSVHENSVLKAHRRCSHRQSMMWMKTHTKF